MTTLYVCKIETITIKIFLLDNRISWILYYNDDNTIKYIYYMKDIMIHIRQYINVDTIDMFLTSLINTVNKIYDTARTMCYDRFLYELIMITGEDTVIKPSRYVIGHILKNAIMNGDTTWLVNSIKCQSFTGTQYNYCIFKNIRMIKSFSIIDLFKCMNTDETNCVVYVDMLYWTLTGPNTCQSIPYNHKEYYNKEYHKIIKTIQVLTNNTPIPSLRIIVQKYIHHFIKVPKKYPEPLTRVNFLKKYK